MPAVPSTPCRLKERLKKVHLLMSAHTPYSVVSITKPSDARVSSMRAKTNCFIELSFHRCLYQATLDGIHKMLACSSFVASTIESRDIDRIVGCENRLVFEVGLRHHLKGRLTRRPVFSLPILLQHYSDQLGQLSVTCFCQLIRL